MAVNDRILIRLKDGARRVIDPADIYFFEAARHDVLVRTHRKERLRDVRQLGEIERDLQLSGFVRISDEHVVNVRRILLIRPQRRGSGWEVKLEPPVNRVLPVAKRRLKDLWDAFGE